METLASSKHICRANDGTQGDGPHRVRNKVPLRLWGLFPCCLSKEGTLFHLGACIQIQPHVLLYYLFVHNNAL